MARPYVCHTLFQLLPLRAPPRHVSAVRFSWQKETKGSCIIRTPSTTELKTKQLIGPSVRCRGMAGWTTTTTVEPLISDNNILRSPLSDIDIPNNIPFHQLIFDACDTFKDALAIEDFLTGRKYTYGQLKDKAVRVASGLHKLGYRKGDLLLLFAANTVDITVLMLACAALGIWISTANSTFTAMELSVQLKHTEAKVVVTSELLADIVRKAVSDPEISNKVKGLFVFGEAPGFQPFQSLLDDDGKSFPDVDINPLEDVLALPYSSGTTGMPKGVMLTHYNCLSNCIQTIPAVPLDIGDHCLGLLPLYHIYGMTVVQFSVLLGGASIFYLPKFDPQIFLRCIQDRQITLAHLAPPLLVFLAKHPLVSQYNLASLRRIICGAAPLGPELTQEFQQRFEHHIGVNQGYGMTELSPICNVDFTETAGAVGPLVVNTKAKVIDTETGQTLGPGQEGEYCVRGPQVMKGYYKNQAATRDMVDADGWLHTGDIGSFNKDGLVFIKDRLKELIKYKGSQVAPAELEAILLAHPCIQDVAVVGVPDDTAGELPRAFVVKKSGSSVSEHDVVKFVEERVSHTKRLRAGVQFVPEIPKNPSGKILRRLLRTKYL